MHDSGGFNILGSNTSSLSCQSGTVAIADHVAWAKLSRANMAIIWHCIRLRPKNALGLRNKSVVRGWLDFPGSCVGGWFFAIAAKRSCRTYSSRHEAIPFKLAAKALLAVGIAILIGFRRVLRAVVKKGV